jgi:hypothetical protein
MLAEEGVWQDNAMESINLLLCCRCRHENEFVVERYCTSASSGTSGIPGKSEDNTENLSLVRTTELVAVGACTQLMCPVRTDTLTETFKIIIYTYGFK